MRRLMVTYRVRPEAAAENEELIRDVFGELHAADPAGLRYAVYARDDGVTFVHVVEHEDGHNPLPELEAFKRYTGAVLERCQEPPVAGEVREIGAFGFGAPAREA
jgi:hypothetical protein